MGPIPAALAVMGKFNRGDAMFQCLHRFLSSAFITLGLLLGLWWAIHWQATATAGGALFLDVSASVGLTAPHQAPPLTYVIGQAWGDYDRDGWPDLYVTNAEGPNLLFHNQSGTFVAAPISSQVAMSVSLSSGALFGDYDNDGYLDLYVLNWGENVLWRNLAGAGFVDVTASAGVGDPGRGQSAAWGDVDQDGHLDLLVANWCSSCDSDAPSALYHNNGDGTFASWTHLLGAGAAGPAYVGAFADYDNDGDLDIYLVKDRLTYANVLWRNDGPGCGGWCWADVSEAAGADAYVQGMGLALGDYDGDLDLDFYFSDAGPMVLLQNQTSQGSPTFLDQSAAAGVDFDAIGWGTAFLDYDRDGGPDLYLATMDADSARANRLFHNQADGTFLDASAGSGASDPRASLGVAYADYNRDGWLDIVVGHWDDSYTLYQNQGAAGQEHHWLHLLVRGGGPVNQDAIGTRLYVTTSDGRTYLQELHNGSGLGGGHALGLYLGLGTALPLTATLVWPDGVTEVWNSPPMDQEWELTYPLAGAVWTPAASHRVAPGQTIHFRHLLTNTGTRLDTLTLQVVATTGSALVTPTQVTLSPQASTWLTVSVSAPTQSFLTFTTTLTAISGRDPAVQAVVVDTIHVGGLERYLPVARRP